MPAGEIVATATAVVGMVQTLAKTLGALRTKPSKKAISEAQDLVLDIQSRVLDVQATALDLQQELAAAHEQNRELTEKVRHAEERLAEGES